MSKKDLETLYVEANTYALASHLFWALWGLIQVTLTHFLFWAGYALIRMTSMTGWYFFSWKIGKDVPDRFRLSRLLFPSIQRVQKAERKELIAGAISPFSMQEWVDRWCLIDHSWIDVCQVCSTRPLIPVVKCCVKYLL